MPTPEEKNHRRGRPESRQPPGPYPLPFVDDSAKPRYRMSFCTLVARASSTLWPGRETAATSSANAERSEAQIGCRRGVI